ncbi:ABC transporter permease subunit [Paenibacillus sp. J5C_2022]|uniref:ABC transporter permease n=1 Tax=Paenibacillus sp. J5C2022 TaxID=2977129 RepID=UPI0021D180D1|nr:ABC transporter permease subunit [Paenibacillus sp. J5C2022]MCU6710386.1 ABC transporter permease subunit [Paenibacillus sp. J5C2022]
MKLWRKLWRQRVLFLFMLPGAAAVLVFAYAPMIGLVIAFQDYRVTDGFLSGDFAGLEHFRTFLSDPEFFNALRNTLVMGGLMILFGFPAPIVLALMIDAVRKTKAKRLIQSITYLPHFITWVFISSLVYRLLESESGIVNLLLMELGLPAVNFMQNPDYFWGILVVTSIWQSVGWNTIIYLAAITSIDPELHSAAMVDGASRFQRMISITLPCIMPTVAILFVLSLGSLFTVNFEAVFNLMNGFVQSKADVIDTYIYRTGVQMANFSYATAIGFARSIITATLVVIGYIISNKINETRLLG